MIRHQPAVVFTSRMAFAQSTLAETDYACRGRVDHGNARAYHFDEQGREMPRA